MKRRLVVCCDGTWNRLSGERVTNVVKTATAVMPTDSDGVPQIVFYDEGVGNGAGVTPRLDRILGGAFGLGLDRNVEDAYRFLVFNYEAGDEIFVFGFSRGAYTARSLVGLIRKCGILRRGHASRSSAAIDHYRDRGVRPGSPVDGQMPGWGSAADIRFLGVWDTVGALGIPGNLPLNKLFNDKYRFHDTELSGIVRNACHAVSIDERRAAFQVTLWDDKRKPDQTIEQVWFPGDHGSVGGGGAERGLSDAAFVWMMERARAAGLAVDPDCLKEPAVRPEPLAAFDNSVWKSGPVVGLAYRVIGLTNRPAPSATGAIHHSAFVRWQNARPAYRPASLRGFAQDLDAHGDNLARAEP